MKISYNWLREYIDIPETPEAIGQVLTDTGLEVEGIDSYQSVRGGLKGLIIGEVVTCGKHPNADRLSITTVNIGNGSVFPIVCGAPNVAAGQKVIVATPGTILYPTKGDPFKIKKSKIRGEVSEGMICAEDEIGLGSEHDGIMVLETSLKNGTPAADYFSLEEDFIIEIGLTPNRGDAASHIGVARDIRAVKNREIKWPKVDGFKIDNNNTPIRVTVENHDACPRYSGVCISNVTIGESPGWLKKRLESIGLTPISNVVDITNFVLHETGQPLHAFDYDEIYGHEVIVKTLDEGSLFTTLDEKERKLHANDLMICDKKKGMCIAGVFGGTNSGVKDTTKNIFLESAYFSPDYIRKTAQYHGLKTDASFHFERGTDPNLTVFALKRAALLMKELAGGEISSEIIDIYPNKIADFEINVSFAHIDRLIGKVIEKPEIKEILSLLDIELKDETKGGFTAIVPAYRSDVMREADVIEEILRIHGFNNVDLPDTLGASYLAEYPENDPQPWLEKISRILTGKGWYEIMTNSLTKPEYTALDRSLDPVESVEIINKLSEDLGVLKQSMLFTGLESVAYNLNRKQESLKFFEFGKTYHKQKEKFTEWNHLSLLTTGLTQPDNWRKKSMETDYYDLIATVNTIFDSMTNLRPEFEYQPIADSVFEYGISIIHNGEKIGSAGQVSSEILNKFEIKSKIFYADLIWDLLLNNTNPNIVTEEVSKFPPVKRDLSLVLDKKISFKEIEAISKETEPRLIKEIRVFDVYEGTSVESGKKAYAISFILQDKEKTLTDKIIDKTMSKLMKAFENKTGALIRQ